MGGLAAKFSGGVFEAGAQLGGAGEGLLQFLFGLLEFGEACVGVDFNGQGDGGPQEDALGGGLGEEQVVGLHGVLHAQRFGQGDGAAGADPEGGVFHGCRITDLR